MSATLWEKLFAIEIDRKAEEPVYSQLKRGVKRILLEENMPAGVRLPSLRDLGKELSISYLTVTKAINELTHSGFLNTVKNRGIYTASKEDKPKKPVAVFLGDYRYYMCAEMLQGISNVFQKEKIEIMPHCGVFGQKMKSALQEMLESNRISGVIGFGDVLTGTDEAFQKLCEEIPIVLLNSCADIKADAVIYSDDAPGMRQLVKLLAEKKHKKVVYLSSSPEHSIGSFRKKAFEKYASEFGLDYLLIEGVMQKDDAYLQAMRLLIEGTQFSAIACWNDVSSAEVLKLLHKQKKRIPEDIAVTGFGNLDYAENLYPPLTTVEQNFLKMGEKAAEALLSAMKKRTCNSPRKITTETKLIIRESV